MKLYKKYLSKFLDQYDGILSNEINIKYEELGEICTDTRKLKKKRYFYCIKWRELQWEHLCSNSM